MSKLPFTGLVVAAHPSRVAQADQLAAAEGIDSVKLSSACPTTHLYVIDLDELLRLSEVPFFDFRSEA